MNVSQLANSVYSNAGMKVSDLSYSNALSKTEQPSSTEQLSSEFAKILSDYVGQNSSIDTTEVENLLQALDSAEKSKDVNPTDVMDILTDTELAKEYLSSQSGRQVVVEMAKNSLADIISDSDN